MNIEELVKMPDIGLLHVIHDQPCPNCRAMLRGIPPLKLGYPADQLRAYSEAVAAAVVKRCIALVIAEDVTPSDFAPGVQECIADAIRREFGEVSK